MWDLPGPGLEPVSPALAGGFLTSALPGKPEGRFLKGCCQVFREAVVGWWETSSRVGFGGTEFCHLISNMSKLTNLAETQFLQLYVVMGDNTSLMSG